MVSQHFIYMIYDGSLPCGCIYRSIKYPWMVWTFSW